MPKRPDASNKTQEGTYTVERTSEGGTYFSQKRASAKWEGSHPCDKITIRLPKGAKEKLLDYVYGMSLEDPENPKYSSFNGKTYLPSISALIRTLLEEEIGERFGQDEKGS